MFISCILDVKAQFNYVCRRRALILTLGKEFLQTEATLFDKECSQHAYSFRDSSFYKHFLRVTIPTSTISFDPPFSQAEDLRLRVKANRQYADIVISEKLYEKAYQSVDRPLNFQIRKISQILSLAETLKSFWVKAELKMSDSQQCLYFLSCPSCTKYCGAAYGYEFTCFYCNNTFPGPIPLLRFQEELSDGTGNLTVYVEHREAQMLLGMTGEELIEAAQEDIKE